MKSHFINFEDDLDLFPNNGKMDTLSQIILSLGKTSKSIRDLINDKNITHYTEGKDIYIQIKNIGDLLEYDQATIDAMLSISRISVTSPQGIFISKLVPNEISTIEYCAGYANGISISTKLPLSTSSIYFTEWNDILLNSPYKYSTTEDYTYSQDFSITMSVIVINYYN